jgi:cytochrome P450
LLLLLREAGLHDGEDASKFDPERWLGEREEQSTPKSLAFGAGPGSAPGATSRSWRPRPPSR